MRDIRNDLRERLAVISARYADEMISYDEKREALDSAHKTAISLLDRERAAVQQLLAFEEQRDGTILPILKVDLVPLADFIVTKVHAHGPLDKDDLRSEAGAAGYFADGNGRTFHTTLMNMTKNGRITKLPDGRYAFPATPKSLFSAVDQTEENAMRTVM